VPGINLFPFCWQKTFLKKIISLNFLFKFFTLLLPGLIWLSAKAQEPALSLSDSTQTYSLAHHAAVLEDESGQMVLSQVLSPESANRFQTDLSRIRRGFLAKTCWIRFTLRNPLPVSQKWMLEETNPALNRIVFFMPSPENDGTFKAQPAGLDTPMEKRSVKSRYPTFAITLPAGAEQTFYLQKAVGSNLNFELKLRSAPVYQEKMETENLVYGLYYGIILIMVLYNFFLFLSIRDMSYLFYVFHISAFGLLQFFMNGFAFEYWVSLSVWWAGRAIPALTGVSSFLGVLFVMKFQHTRQVSPLFHKILWGEGILGLLVAVFSLIVPVTRWALVLASANGVVFALVVLASIAACWQNHYRPARYLLAAWLVFLVGILLLAFYTLGFLPYHFLTVNGMQIGSVLETFLLSLALGDRINLLQTEKNKAQVEMRQLEQQSRFKEQFLAHVSHEIRTPMNGIIGFARLLARSPLNTVQKNHVQNIQRSADNLLVIINDILDVTKIESGKMIFEEVDLHLPSLCNSLTDTMQFKVAEKSIGLRYRIDKNVPQTVLGDPVRVNQILLNLLSNSVKFTDKGFVELSIHLAEEQADTVRLRFDVSDTGIGIPADKLASIFESYTQASADTTRKYGGTGLGLTIVKQLTELQGGRIEVKSEAGTGSVFSVIIPFKKVAVVTETEFLVKESLTEMQEKISESNLPTAYILICEDNPVNQTLAVQTILESNPYIRIDLAENGRIGIERLLENDYDLILMDMQMPVLDGYETTLHIRSQLPEPKRSIPIIALTADVLLDNQRKILDSGMNDYIYKPFHAAELFLKMEKLNIKSLQPSADKVKFEVGTIRKTTMGNTEFMLELMNMFTDKMPQFVAEMQDFAEQKDWKNLSFISHKNKTLFVVMGMNDLHTQLVEIETMALIGEDSEELHNRVKTFCRQCEEVSKQISQEKGRLVAR
jgi:two-component system, sensor histidine kinase LadS